MIQQWIANVLNELGWPQAHLPLGEHLLGVISLIIIAMVSYYIVKHRILVLIQALVKKSKNQWDDLLVEHKLFTKIALLIPYFLIYLIAPHALPLDTAMINVVLIVVKIAIVFQIARCICSLLDVIKSMSLGKAKTRYLPLNASVQLIKLAIYLVATILAISIMIDRSPIFLLSGLGALTAVLLLVFQDTIKGLVASIQIAANKMVAPGDWVELPQYGADGDVIEIGLNTVKIQNFDRTVTTVPTYALISGSFKNWRDMFNSGGRRIKRSINIDINSISFYHKGDIERLQKISLLIPYLSKKISELEDHHRQLNIAPEDYVNQRQLTNIGTFRAYIEAYLHQHKNVHQDMTCMVRQLAPSATGIPLELYFFSNDQNWVNYESIQADIFDHLYAIAPAFGLRIFQHPTGFDWQKH